MMLCQMKCVCTLTVMLKCITATLCACVDVSVQTVNTTIIIERKNDRLENCLFFFFCYPLLIFLPDSELQSGLSGLRVSHLKRGERGSLSCGRNSSTKVRS